MLGSLSMAPASPWGGPDAVGREEGSRGGGGRGGVAG